MECINAELVINHSAVAHVSEILRKPVVNSAGFHL